MSIEMREVVVEQKQHVGVVVCDECKASVEVSSQWFERPLGWLRVEADLLSKDFCSRECLMRGMASARKEPAA